MQPVFDQCKVSYYSAIIYHNSHLYRFDNCEEFTNVTPLFHVSVADSISKDHTVSVCNFGH